MEEAAYGPSLEAVFFTLVMPALREEVEKDISNSPKKKNYNFKQQKQQEINFHKPIPIVP